MDVMVCLYKLWELLILPPFHIKETQYIIL